MFQGLGLKAAINRGGVGTGFQCKSGGALLEEARAGAFEKRFQPGLRPARDAFNQRGFINEELTLTSKPLKALNPKTLAP